MFPKIDTNFRQVDARVVNSGTSNFNSDYYVGTDKNKRKFGLDFFRAIAIAMVVIAHSDVFFTGGARYLIEKSNFGFFGVALFFALSGFLIGQILIKEFSKSNGFTTVRKFWIRRWLRTLPNYYLFLLINTIIGFLLISNFVKFFASWNYLSYLFFMQNFFSRVNANYFFGVSWSLAIEELFYFLTPLIILCILNLDKNNRRPVFYSAIILIIFSIGLRIFFAYNFPGYSLSDLRMITPLGLDAIGFGVFAFCIKFYYKNFWNNNRFKLAGFSFVILILCILSSMFKITYLPMGKVLTISAVPILFVLLLPLGDAWNPVMNFWKKCIQAVSAWSYSIYLCHIPLMSILAYFFQKVNISFYNPITYILYVFIVLLLSKFIYLKFEKPILDMRESIAE